MGSSRVESASSVGRYELVIELARGGMAELFVGRLRGVGGFAKLVAIKRILPHLAEDALFVQMFLDEGRIAAQLAHANICQVHELGEADGELFLAMEYLEGVPWSDLARRVPRDDLVATLRLAAGVIAQACDGLHYAHELRDLAGTPTPVVHRDVSPQNLFVTSAGTCKVLDFGIAKMVKDGPRTRTGVLKGKLPYMSPEQIQGETLDARSDVFALGVCLWEAVAGRSLFDRETDFLIWKAITEAEIPPLAPFGVPPAVDAVIASALARDRQRRFRSARAFGEALRTAIEPIGGAYDAAAIAQAVRTHCAPVLAERQREIAAAIAQRTGGEPTAADTIEEHAGSTVDLPRTREASSTVRLRSDAKPIVRDAGGVARNDAGGSAGGRPDDVASSDVARRGADELAPGRSGDAARDERARHAPARSRAAYVIAAAIVVAAVILALAITRRAGTPAPVATTPAADAAVGSDVDEALDTVQQMSGTRDLDKLMKSVESLSAWGKRMQQVGEDVRARAHGAQSADEQPDAATDE